MWIFFRDDDLGWDPKGFARLVTLFARHDQKLNGAAIPAAITEEVIQESIPYSYQAAPFLQVVSHGYRHQNYEPSGKKCEFGPSRDPREVKKELLEGRIFLAGRFENYFPCFVPPWNRISGEHLPFLKECGYKMLSRDESDRPEKSPVLEYDVFLDLHTEKKGRRLDAKQIFLQLAERHEAGKDASGLMLHHSRMNEDDFETLDQLLKNLSKRGLQSCFFSDMVPGMEPRSKIELTHV